MPDDEELPESKLIPPNPKRVAKRALVMATVIHRAFMEPYSTEPEVKDQCQRALTWLAQLHLSDELELEEKQILDTPLGQLSSRQAIRSTWRTEGLVVLAWALNRFDKLPYDELADPKAVSDSLYFLRDEAESLLTTPQLRAKDELEQYAEQMFALHWRLREFSLNPRKIDFRQVAKETWFGPLEVSELRFIDDDLAVGDTEISKASEEEIWTCVSIASERHQAANWLIGSQEIYSEVDTST